MSRKIAEELLQRRRLRSMGRGRKGLPPKRDSELDGGLWRIWKVAGQPCGKRLKSNSEVSERGYFHAEARGSRRDFCKVRNPKALCFRPFNHSAGTSVFGLKSLPPRLLPR
jgi:hypothetical protein